MSATREHCNVGMRPADTLAIVLAGGKGAGLKGLTERRAKPAVPFGGRYRIIDFPLSNCINSGIRSISVLAQYNAQSLRRHLRRSWAFLPADLGEFVEVLSAEPGVGAGWYEGTADAVCKNLDIIREYDPRYVLILGGDTICKMDYGRMIDAHAASGADLTVGCTPVPLEEAGAYGVMTVDENQRILSFAEKPQHPEPMGDDPDKALASMGVYVFTAGFLRDRLLEDAGRETSGHDFGRDLIPAAVREADLFACRFITATGAPPYWRDVGSLDDYYGVNMDLVAEQSALDLHDPDWPIRSQPRPWPPARFVFDEDGRRGHAVDSLVSEGCRVSGAVVRRSVLSPNVQVHSHSEVEDAVVLSDVEIGRSCRIRHAIIDEGVVIPEGTEIGHHSEEDRRRFEVSQGGVVLVTSAP